jgi:hypothetical protein
MDKDHILCYKFGTFLILNLSDLQTKKIMKLGFSWKHNILSRIRLLSRLLRLDVRYGIKISDFRFIIVRDRVLYELDIKTKKISSGCRLNRGSRPLNIVPIKIRGFDDAVYYGEYFGNQNKASVSIYKRINEDNWEKVYEFPEGEINHIHNLIPDEINGCVWILTGDFDNSAAIWQAKNNFMDVKAIKRGTQEYRSCVAFPILGGIIYATDTPFQRNSLRILNQKDGEWQSFEICTINGSVIYSTNLGDFFIFSTVVENNGGEPLLRKILTFKRGDGIIKNECVVYQVNKEKNVTEILHNKKDIFSFYLFQFGAIIFPTGHNFSNYLPIYNIGTVKNDLSLILYKIMPES